MKQILEGYSTKELVWDFKSQLDKYLPQHLKEASGNYYTPDNIINQIIAKQKTLDEYADAKLEELIKKEILTHRKWIQQVEKELTDEQKMMKAKCNDTIAELEEWKPEAESSNHLKSLLIKQIRDYIDYNLYEMLEVPTILTFEHAKSRILKHKEELTESIEQLRKKYSNALEYQKQKNILESQLLRDLELLK